MTEDNIRFSITLSPYDFRKLKLWAKVRGRPPAAFAAQIIAARLEANAGKYQSATRRVWAIQKYFYRRTRS